MNLRARLDQLLGGETRPPAPPPARPRGPLEQLLPGRLLQGTSGTFYLSERHQPLERPHGPWPLSQACEFPRRWLQRLLGAPQPGLEEVRLEPRRFLFLDTETTGLSGGAGTYAFLVGLAWIGPEGIHLEQLVMREHREERALLEHLAGRIRESGLLITYNGKSFDLPLLQTRFTLQRLPVDLGGIPHLDLLHPSRRVWGPGLGDCRLETLEEEILGCPRSEDVPGREIPEIYFHFLKTGEAEGLARVAEHNRRDLLALMGLASGLAASLASPMTPRPGAQDFGLGRMLGALGEPQTGSDLLERALSGPLPGSCRARALLELAGWRKRRGEIEAALGLWRGLLEEDPGHPVASEELAKHLEHREGRAQEALGWVDRALARSDLTEARRRDLEHRRRRLSRKAFQAEAPNWPRDPGLRGAPPQAVAESPTAQARLQVEAGTEP